MTTLDDLLAYLFDRKRTALYGEFEGWARGSRRFAAFATTYRDKIRTKVRNAPDGGGTQDLRAELETAALLLREGRFSLEYEKYAALKQRGPDFTVTFKTHTPFNVEVRRIRGDLDEGDAEARESRLVAALCDKVGQMPPGIANLLWLADEAGLSEDDLAGAMGTLRSLAERKVEAFFTRRGFESAAVFLRQFQRLSGIVLRRPEGIIVCLNPLARHKAPPEIVNAIRRLDAA